MSLGAQVEKRSQGCGHAELPAPSLGLSCGYPNCLPLCSPPSVISHFGVVAVSTSHTHRTTFLPRAAVLGSGGASDGASIDLDPEKLKEQIEQKLEATLETLT